MGYKGGAAGVGVVLGLLFGMMLDQTAWAVIVGAVLGFAVGTFIDLQRSRP